MVCQGERVCVVEDGVEHLDCLLQIEQAGREVGVGVVEEIWMSGFRIAKEFD